MLDKWSYLLGTRQELEPIWKAYYIGVLPDLDGHDQVMHNAPIFLIDRSGLRQSLHTTGGETNAIIGEVVHDVRMLLDK
jgi:cytochrome oxidase Cu insertion factor (SCO1/SenC/PrrC family)